MKNLSSEQLLQSNKRMRKSAAELAGVDSEKVQKIVSNYLQIARDNQLNYNELLQVFAITKATVRQSLNKLSLSVLPAAISDDANV